MQYPRIFVIVKKVGIKGREKNETAMGVELKTPRATAQRLAVVDGMSIGELFCKNDACGWLVENAVYDRTQRTATMPPRIPWIVDRGSWVANPWFIYFSEWTTLIAKHFLLFGKFSNFNYFPSYKWFEKNIATWDSENILKERNSEKFTEFRWWKGSKTSSCE